MERKLLIGRESGLSGCRAGLRLVSFIEIHLSAHPLIQPAAIRVLF